MNCVVQTGEFNHQDLLQSTPILDFHSHNIQSLIEQRGWRNSTSQDAAARSVYEFCRDEVLFGYNAGADDTPASRVLTDRMGHCNTKTNLLMALLRSLDIPCRMHAFTIFKSLQRGALTRFVYYMAPKEIFHTWTEAFVNNHWIALEGLILDRAYLEAVQNRFSACKHPFLGYAVATKNLQNPPIEWTGGDTFIQREGIARELGVFNTPDEFYAQHQTNLKGLKGWLYRNYFYKQLNKNIANIRAGNTQPSNEGCTHR